MRTSRQGTARPNRVGSWLPAMSGGSGMLGVAAFNPSLRALALTGVIWLVGLGLQEWAHLKSQEMQHRHEQKMAKLQRKK